MRIRVYPYQQASQSARALARALGGKVLYTDDRSRFRARYSDVVINWGSTTAPHSYGGRAPGQLLNHPNEVAIASNKLALFQASLHWHNAEAREVIVPWTTDKGEAEDWIEDNNKVVVRHSLTGRGGQGIELVGEEVFLVDGDYRGTLPDAPLYTKYIKKSAEYRVHVAVDAPAWLDGYQVFDVQQKRRSHGVDDDDVNYQIRNYDNGWVYCRDNVSANPKATDAAVHVVKNLGLDFGAVDVVYNAHHERAYVLEVNTAPGLEGTTLDKYVNMIRARVRG